MKNCYCTSNKLFENCCEPFLNKTIFPQIPEQLMRSRYSAYAIHNADYLIETTHVSERKNYSKAEILHWSKSNTWIKLEILEAHDNIVEFKAYYEDSEGLHVQHERSNFTFEDDIWLYKDGKLFNSKIERNILCPCQSGKKYKKCCNKAS